MSKWSETDIRSFREAQRLAHESVLSIAKVLEVGMSEKEVCGLIEQYLNDIGVKSFFHKPFAWFGDRTKYHKFKNPLDFLPSKKLLKKGDVVILDVAPIVNGYVADVGYTFVFQDNPSLELKNARNILLKIRKEIPELFMSNLSTTEIWHKVENDLIESGFTNVYKKYPFSVLAHRVHKVPLKNMSGFISPFGLHSFWSIFSRGVFPELLGPKHKGSKLGVWAVEPHLGGDQFGAKFEELLIVEEDEQGKIKAKWIDDDVPHLKGGWPCL